MRSAATRSSMRKTRLEGLDRSPERGHELVTVDLFQGWTPSADTSDDAEIQSDQIDPALSHDDPSSLATSADAPSFKSIGFPTSSLPPSLSTEGRVAQHDAGDKAELKKIAPSKRPGVSHAKKTAPDHIKRPRNAYIIFRSHIVSQKLIPKEVEHDHRNISRIIAHMWKSLAQEDRAHYEKIAYEEKERHKQLFPNYRYQPTTRRTNVNKRNVKKLENGDEECQEIADIILKAQGKGGVAANPEPRKPTKRTREATRPQQENDTESAAEPSPRKRAKPTKTPSKVTKVAKTPKTHSVAKGTHGNGDANESEQTLETVFLYHSSSPSPSVSSCSSAAIASVAVASPEPLRLSPETPPAARQDTHGDEQGAGASIFGRRASSVPLVPFYCLPPPPAIALSDHEGYQASVHPQSFGVPIEREQLQSIQGQLDVVQIDQGRDDGRDMPAPAWKGRRSQPPPIPNTWQNCSFDEPSLPSPRTMGFCGASSKHGMGRPRTAMPSTPSSASFRGFFHPWAFDHSDESTLISPMNVSFQDGRRRSSIIRHGSLTDVGTALSASNRPAASVAAQSRPTSVAVRARMRIPPTSTFSNTPQMLHQSVSESRVSQAARMRRFHSLLIPPWRGRDVRRCRAILSPVLALRSPRARWQLPPATGRASKTARVGTPTVPHTSLSLRASPHRNLSSRRRRKMQEILRLKSRWNEQFCWRWASTLARMSTAPNAAPRLFSRSCRRSLPSRRTIRKHRNRSTPTKAPSSSVTTELTPPRLPWTRAVERPSADPVLRRAPFVPPQASIASKPSMAAEAPKRFPRLCISHVPTINWPQTRMPIHTQLPNIASECSQHLVSPHLIVESCLI